MVVTVLVTLRRLRGYAVFGYGVAVLVIGLASAVQWLLRDEFAGAPFLVIYPAVIMATFFGGVGPGFFSAVLAGASQFGVFIPSFHWVAVGSYVFDAIVCVMLIVFINRTLDLLVLNVESEKEAKQHQVIVASELHHRIQNLLTVIQAIVRFTIPATGSVNARETREQLLDRIQSIAAANKAIADAVGEDVRLVDLIGREIHGFEARCEFDESSEVTLGPRMAQNFSLVIHELLTNAVKHGALSVPEGRISIDILWNAPLLTFIWQERQAPREAESGNAGFGSLLLGDFAKSFSQTVEATYTHGGLRYVLKVESDEIK